MKIFCLGDSLVFSYGVPRPSAWVRQLSALTGLCCVNAGVNGDTTAGMLERLRAQSLSEVSAVLLMGGYNDIFQTDTDKSARENLVRMLDLLETEGVPALVLIPHELGSGFPPEWEENTDFENARRVIAEYTDWLAATCRERGVRTVDLRRVIGPERLFDGIHPDETAQTLIAGAVKEML